MISCGWSNRTPWHTPREMDEDDLERRIEKMAAEVTRPERAVFNLHVPPARTAIDLAPALDDSLKPVVKGGAVVMESVGSEAVRRVLERHQPMLGLHGHIHESRGAVRLGRTLSINPGSEYGDGILRGALIELDGRQGDQELPAARPARRRQRHRTRQARGGQWISELSAIGSSSSGNGCTPAQSSCWSGWSGPVTGRRARRSCVSRCAASRPARSASRCSTARPRSCAATAPWSGMPTARSTWTCWPGSRYRTSGTAIPP